MSVSASGACDALSVPSTTEDLLLPVISAFTESLLLISDDISSCGRSNENSNLTTGSATTLTPVADMISYFQSPEHPSFDYLDMRNARETTSTVLEGGMEVPSKVRAEPLQVRGSRSHRILAGSLLDVEAESSVTKPLHYFQSSLDFL